MFVRTGDYWTLAYQDTVVRMRDAKGLRYLAHLLRSPGTAIPAATLAVAEDDPAGDSPPPTRRRSPSAEQARVAVTKRIKESIKSITRHHQALGFHLATSIKTGATCAYLQDPGRPTVWTGGVAGAFDDVPRALDRPPRVQPGHGSERPLSQREREILMLLAEGASLKEAAARLDLSYRTVETYIHRVKARERQTRLHGLLVQLVRAGKL